MAEVNNNAEIEQQLKTHVRVRILYEMYKKVLIVTTYFISLEHEFGWRQF